MESIKTQPQRIDMESRISMLALAIRKYAIAFLFLLCIATLWLGLDASRLWDRDEPRNARCAVEMLDRGDWIVPTFNDQLRTHKPILLYWLQMTCFCIFGETDFAARAASALMATVAVFATFWLGKKLIDSAAGFWSAASLATSLMFVVAGRAATPDACLVATSTIGIVGLVLHWKTGSKQFTRYATLGYLALGLAILAKGPVGIILPMMVVFLWGLVQPSNANMNSPPRELPSASRRTRIRIACIGLLEKTWSVTRRLLVIRGLLLALAVAVPWYIWVGIRTDGEWLYGFFFEHNLGRAMSAMEGHGGGIWFYPAASLIGLFPWSLMLVPIAIWVASQRRDAKHSPAIQLGLIWLGVYVVLFSIARTKLPSYITPSYPGAALLIGGFLSHWADRRHVLSVRWLRIAASVYALIGISVITAIAYLAFREQMPKIFPHACWGIGFLIVAAMMVSAIGNGNQHRLPWAMLACSTLFLSGLFSSASATAGRYRDDLEAILSQAEYTDAEGQRFPTEWISLRSIEPSWVYYLKTPIPELPKIEASRKTPSDEGLQRVVECLRKTSGRVIVDADSVLEIERILAERYNLPVKRAVAFKSFLKSNEIVVLQSEALNKSQASRPRMMR